MATTKKRTQKTKIKRAEPQLPVKRSRVLLPDIKQFRLQAAVDLLPALQAADNIIGRVKDQASYERAIAAGQELRRGINRISEPYKRLVHAPIKQIWQASNQIQKEVLIPAKDRLDALQHETGTWWAEEKSKRETEEARRRAEIARRQEEAERKRRAEANRLEAELLEADHEEALLLNDYLDKRRAREEQIRRDDEDRIRREEDARLERAAAAEDEGDPDLAMALLGEQGPLAPARPAPPPVEPPPALKAIAAKISKSVDVPVYIEKPGAEVPLPAVTAQPIEKAAGHAILERCRVIIIKPMELVRAIADGHLPISILRDPEKWDTPELERLAKKAMGKEDALPGCRIIPEYSSIIRE